METYVFEVLGECLKNHLIICILRILSVIFLIYTVNTFLVGNVMATSNWPFPNYHKLASIFIYMSVLLLNLNLIAIHFAALIDRFPASFMPVATQTSHHY